MADERTAFSAEPHPETVTSPRIVVDQHDAFHSIGHAEKCATSGSVRASLFRPVTRIDRLPMVREIRRRVFHAPCRLVAWPARLFRRLDKALLSGCFE